tara:strand:+ start:2333 stop:2803 length:471 start_codon:yes stop_codon:yes gene_type:complete
MIALLMTLVSSKMNYELHTSWDVNFEDYFIENLQKAKKSIDGFVYKFKSDTIYNVLEEKGKDGVNFRLICDINEAWSNDQYCQKFAKYGEVVPFKSKDFDKLHAKGILIDKQLLLIGSSNLDNNSITDNMEILAAINDTKMASTFENIFNMVFDEM